MITRTNDTEESDNDDNGNSPDPKRARRVRNHNAQVIYKNPDTSVPLPSLMKMNDMSSSPWSQPPPTMDAWNTSQPPPMLNANQPPPSLMNMHLGRPGYDESNGNANWQQQPPPPANAPPQSKRRNRDSDGNRISRFDQNPRPSRFDNADNGRNNNNNNTNNGNNGRRGQRRI